MTIPSSTEWLEDEKETILLFGSAKIGKTWAYCSMIEEVVKSGSVVRILNTDGGVARTFKQYFADKIDDVKDKVIYYFVESINEAHRLLPNIKQISKPNDWIVVDLMSDFWDMAQNKFIEDASGGDVTMYIVRSAKDTKKFGMFDGQKWQYIKKLDNFIIDNLVLRPKCNVLAVCAEKDMEVEMAMSKGKVNEASKNFVELGVKPAGQGRLSYKFNTIVYIGESNAQHYFRIVGDRGKKATGTMHAYQKNWYEKFKSARN